MKSKLAPAEKNRRQAWRDQALENRTVLGPQAKQLHLPKALRTNDRIGKIRQIEISEDKEPRAVLADLFKGTTYAGPYVRVTHKHAFEARVAKRALKQAASDLANVAMETQTYPDGSPVVCELGESAESIENRRREALTDRIDQAEEER